MKKHLLKRSLAMLLAVLTVMATVPLMAVPAFAASGTLSFDDSNIGLKYTTANATTLTSTYGTWSASGTTIEGNAKASNFSAKSGSLTITNNYATKMLISFSYACTATSSSTTIKIDGNSITGSGSFSKEVDAAGTIKIEISAAKKEEGTIKITDFLALDPNKEVTLTFQAPKNGSYSVNGATISNETSVTNLATELWTLKASPASGYKFICWYDVTDEKVLSTDLEYSNYFDSNRTIVAKFASTAAAVFMVEEQIFGDLGDAVTYAQNNSKTLIKLASNGTVTGQYTIPAGITLLIPFDDDYTLYTTKPGYVESNVTPVAYRTMTMATGSSITVNGSISVGGKHYTSTSQTACKPTGPYGHIKMEADSNIVLNNGANLYAWGYITGNGSITANSGATVYEYFQIVDWRGGGKTSEMAGNEQKVFPFTQYYVQNIEASLTLKQGANEYVYITLTVSGQHADATVNFIGDNGLFALGSDGSITKKYDATQSKLKIDISGTASLNSIALSATILLQKIDVDSSDYVLPINGNIDITVKSGTTTITKDVALLPGVVATIEEGAELKVASGATLYVYEAGTWATNFTWGTNTLPYSPTNTNRINYTIKGVSAKLDVNGTLTSDGDIYTTACEDENEGIIASNICSSKGTGVFVKNAETEVEGITYQVIQTSNGLAYEEIPVLCAWLRNADGSYTDSFEAEVGTKIYYTQGTWTIPESEVTVTFKPNGGSGSDTTQTVTNGVATALDANTFTRTGYTFVGWNTEADGTGTLYNDKETLTLSSDITLYAQWEKITYTVIWQNDDGSELYRATFKYGEQEPTYNGTTPTAANTTEGYTYTFKSWNKTTSETTITYVAEYTSTLMTFTITWKNYDGEILQTSTNVPYGEIPTFIDATPTKQGTAQYGYTFSGWSPEVSEAKSDVTYTAQFTEHINTYTITFDANGGTGSMTPQSADYGEEIQLNANSFTREGHTFCGWTTNANRTGDFYYNEDTITVKAHLTLYAQWNADEYFVIWKNNDGSTLLTANYRYGQSEPTYTGTPTAANPQEGTNYTFDKWVKSVDGNTTIYTATYTSAAKTFTVTWKNHDGGILETDTNVPYGTTPSYDSTTPVKQGDAQYSYTFSGWSPEVSEAKSDITYTAQFTEHINTYTITFDANGGTGSMTPQSGNYGQVTLRKANYFYKEGYTFNGWNTKSDGTGTSYNDGATIVLDDDITLYVQWEEIILTVIWKNYDGSELYRTTYKYSEEPIGPYDYPYEYPTKPSTTTAPCYSYEFIFWQYDEENSSANDYISIFIAQFKSLREKWHTDDNGTSYYEADEKKYVSSWAGIDGAYYYFDDEGYIVKDYNRLPYPTELLPQYAPDEEDSRVNKKDQPGYLEEVGEYPDDDSAIFYFGDDGKFKIDYCGTYDDNGVTRFIDHGMLIWHAGLVELDGDYYYFKRTGMVKNGEYYVADTNGLLKTAKYNFASDGKLIKLEGIRKDPFNSNILRYYRNYSAVYYAGLIEVDGDYYYVNEACEAVKDGAYLVKKTNGLLNGNDNGFYMFDEDGKVCKDRNGLMVDYEESGQYLYYYVQGERVYAGLVEGYGGYYYYIKSDLTAARNGEFWVTKVNDTGIKAGYKRTFNDEGCMVMKNGVELYDAGKNIYVYYENDDMVIAPEGETVERVLDDGRKINIDEYGVVTFLSEQNGLVFEDNGDICYYENGVKVTNKGLVQDDDGNFYYINWTGKAVKNGEFWVTIVNDTGVKSGLKRTFDADGKMVVKNGLELYAHKTSKDGYEYDIYVYYINDDIAINMAETQLSDGRTVYTDDDGVVHFKEN